MSDKSPNSGTSAMNPKVRWRTPFCDVFLLALLSAGLAFCLWVRQLSTRATRSRWHHRRKPTPGLSISGAAQSLCHPMTYVWRRHFHSSGSASNEGVKLKRYVGRISMPKISDITREITAELNLGGY